MRPRWRWWLFCAANALDVRFGWRWARRAWAWSLPADWCGDQFDGTDLEGEAPF